MVGYRTPEPEVARLRAPVARAEGARFFGELDCRRINLGEAVRPVDLGLFGVQPSLVDAESPLNRVHPLRISSPVSRLQVFPSLGHYARGWVLALAAG